MKGSEMLLKSLAICLAMISIALASKNEEANPKTADQVAQSREELVGSKRFPIRFRVRSTDRVNVSFPNGTTTNRLRLHPEFNHSNATDFTVDIHSTVETRLKALGIENVAEHLEGTTIEILGTVSRTGLHLIGRESIWFYHVDVCELNQILCVAKPTPVFLRCPEVTSAR